MQVRFAALSVASALLIGSAAFAQVPAPARPTFGPATGGIDDWTGLYFGGTLGPVSGTFAAPITFASFTNSGQTVPSETVMVGPLGGTSVAAGLQVGYGVKLTQSLVGQGEFAFSHAAPSITQSLGTQAAGLGFFVPADTFTMSGGTTTSLRLRVGTTMMPDLFVYGTIGVAIVDVTSTGAFPAAVPAASGMESHTMKGFTYGAGAEYAPFKAGSLRSVTVGAEFRHVSLGTVTFNFGDVQIFESAPPVTEPALGAVTASENEFDVRVNVRLKLWR